MEGTRVRNCTYILNVDACSSYPPPVSHSELCLERCSPSSCFLNVLQMSHVSPLDVPHVPPHLTLSTSQTELIIRPWTCAAWSWTGLRGQPCHIARPGKETSLAISFCLPDSARLCSPPDIYALVLLARGCPPNAYLLLTPFSWQGPCAPHPHRCVLPCCASVGRMLLLGKPLSP